MSILDLVFDPQKKQRKRRVMLYGVDGVGKTTFAASAPKPIFVPTEDGLMNIRGVKSLPVAKSFGQFWSYLDGLQDDPHQFQTLVIDSMDWLEKLIWKQVAADKEVDSITDIPYGKGYDFATDIWRALADKLEDINLQRDMWIIQIAHCQIERFQDPTSEAYDRYSPRLHKFASAFLREWSDEVLFATYKTYIKSEEIGPKKKRTTGIGNGERVLKTSARPAHLAKNRLNIPDEIPLSWPAYFQYADHPPEHHHEERTEEISQEERSDAAEPETANA